MSLGLGEAKSRPLGSMHFVVSVGLVWKIHFYRPLGLLILLNLLKLFNSITPIVEGWLSRIHNLGLPIILDNLKRSVHFMRLLFRRTSYLRWSHWNNFSLLLRHMATLSIILLEVWLLSIMLLLLIRFSGPFILRSLHGSPLVFSLLLCPDSGRREWIILKRSSASNNLDFFNLLMLCLYLLIRTLLLFTSWIGIIWTESSTILFAAGMRPLNIWTRALPGWLSLQTR